MSLPFTADELAVAVAAGDVTARRHPVLPYTVYNYAPEIQYSNKWNDITLNCRGLILDDDFNIIARPWRKFFNLGQVDLPIQFDTPVEIMDKADGSLGILYPHIVDTDEFFDIHWRVATRGSFTSEQAKYATLLWQAKYSDLDPMPGYTMLFEIIYPANRIVLNYGDMEDLILLGAVENSTGYYIGPDEARFLWRERGRSENYLGYSEWPGPVVDVMPFNTLSEALANTDRKNAEGFVIRSHNFMVKLKQPDYLELHRLVTNASPLTVWEKLRDGKSRSEIVSAFPDEFHDYIGSMIDPLLEAYETRLEEILKVFGFARSAAEMRAANTGLDLSCSRAQYAAEFKQYKDAKYFFALLDNKPIRGVLWSELRPAGKGPGAWSEPGPDNSL